MNIPSIPHPFDHIPIGDGYVVRWHKIDDYRVRGEVWNSLGVNLEKGAVSVFETVSNTPVLLQKAEQPIFEVMVEWHGCMDLTFSPKTFDDLPHRRFCGGGSIRVFGKLLETVFSLARNYIKEAHEREWEEVC